MTDQDQKGPVPQRSTGELFAQQDDKTTQLRIERTVVCPYCRASQHIEIGIDGVFCPGCKKFYEVKKGRVVKFNGETVGRKCSSCGEVAQASPKAQVILCSCGSKCEFKGAEALILKHADCPNCGLSMPYAKEEDKPLVCKKCGYDFVTCKMPEPEPQLQSKPSLAEKPDDSSDYLRAQLKDKNDRVVELEDMIKKLAESKSGEQARIAEVVRRSDENLKLAQDTAEENFRLANEIADLKEQLGKVPNPAEIENFRIESEENLKKLKRLMAENDNLVKENVAMKGLSDKNAVVNEAALTSARQEIDRLKKSVDEIPGLKTRLEAAQKQANRATELEAALSAKEKELSEITDKGEVGVTTELLQLRYEIPGLKASLETVKSEKSAAQKAAEELRQEVSSLKKTKSEQAGKITESEQMVSGCEARIAQLDGEKQELIAEFSRNSESLVSEIKKLEAVLFSRQSDLDLATAQIAKNAEEIAKQKELLSSMKKTLDSRDGQIADLTSIVSVLEKENKEGGKAKLDLEEEIARFKSEVELLKNQHQATFDRLIEKQKELHGQKEASDQDLRNRDEEISRLGKKIDSLEAEISQFAERKAELVAQIDSAEDALRAEQGKFSELEIALKKAETEKSGNQAQITELTRKLRELREDYDRQADQLKGLRDDIQRAKDAEAENKRQVMVLSSERDGLKTAKENLTSEVMELREKIKGNNTEIESLKKQAIDLENAKKEAERKHQQEAEVRIRLKEKLDQLATRLEELRTLKSALTDECAAKDKELAGLRARAAIVEAQAKSNTEELSRLETVRADFKAKEAAFEKRFADMVDAEKARLYSDLQAFKTELLRQNEKQVADAVRAAIGYKEGELDSRTKILDKRQSEVEKISEQVKLTRAERAELERDKAEFEKLVAKEVAQLSAVELAKLGANHAESKANMLEKLNSSMIKGFGQSLDLKEKLKFSALGGMIVFMLSLFFILLS